MDSWKHFGQSTNHHHCVSVEMSLADRESLRDIFELVRTDNVEKLSSLGGSRQLLSLDESGSTLLHRAVDSQSLAVLQFLLDDGLISINAQDGNGDTPLHLAVRSGNAKAVTMVMERGADDTITNTSQDPPLHVLLRTKNCCELLPIFLKHPISIMVKGARDFTALHVIAEQDKIEALEIVWPVLCSRDSLSELKMYTRDTTGRSPLHIAAHRGSHRVLDFLISKAMECGASPDHVLHLMDEGCYTPLHTAVDHGHKAVVDVLLKYGASPTTQRGDTLPPIHLACTQSKTDIVKEMVTVCGREILLSEDTHGATPLHCCAKSICDQLFSFVIEHGSDVNAQDNSGTTPLHSAAKQGSAWRVKFLLHKGADPLITNKRGYNPFHLSLIHHREEAMRVLTGSEHASVLSVTPDADGNYPVHLAVKHRVSQAVPTLLSLMSASDCSKALEFQDAAGNNVLHAAAKYGDVTSVEYVLSQPCSRYLLNSLNSLGHTPLHLAAYSGVTASVRLLLDHGAIANKCHHGDTPFMLACLGGHLEAAALLLEASTVNKSAVNGSGDNALHLAARGKNIDVVLMCLDNGLPITLNKSSQSFFDLILGEGSVEMITGVLRHERWEECLDKCSPHLPHPVLRIIETAPEAYQVVLDRSLTHSAHSPESRDYWVEYRFKYITLDHTQHSTPLGVPLSNHSTTSIDILPESPVLDGAPPTQEVTHKGKSHHSFSVLSHLIKLRHQTYLVHPLIATFLDQKWRRYARFYYTFRFVIFFLFSLFLSVFILTTPPPPQFPPVGNVTASEDSEGFGTSSVVFRFLTIALALPNLIVWVLDLYILGLNALRHCVSELEVWAHGLTLVLTLIFTVPWEGLNILHWEVGAVAVFLAWIKVALALQPFSVVGIFVTMLLTVTKNVFSVLVISFIVVCAFALPLYLLLATVPDFTYATIGTSLFSVLASLHAELDYRNFVLLDLTSQLGYPVLAFLFLCLATVVMPIVVINLLIGLAVGDIARIQREAVLSQRAVEVRALMALDSRLPTSLLNRLSQQSCKHYPNKSVADKVTRAVRGLWSEFAESAANPGRAEESRDEPTHREHLKKLLEMEECVVRVELEQAHQQEALRRIEDMLKTLVAQDLKT